MFHLLDKYARDDSIVKLVFDHLRNVGLIALVLGAAAWKQKHIGMSGVAVWDHVVVAVLSFIGFGLMWLNHENLFHKLRNSNVNRWLEFFFVFLYVIVFSEILGYVQAR